MMQNDFFPDESRFCSFSQLQQDKINGRSFLVPQQTQTLSLQSVFGCSGDQLCKTLRLVNQKEVTAEL